MISFWVDNQTILINVKLNLDLFILNDWENLRNRNLQHDLEYFAAYAFILLSELDNNL